MADPTLTFSTRRETRKAVIDHMMDDEGAVLILADPLTKRNPEGGTRTSVGFPVAIMTGWVSEPEKVAALIAELMTEHYAKAEGKS